MRARREKGDPRWITILGSTGSIGLSTLDVIARHPGRFRVIALTARRDVARMREQCRAFGPRYAVMADEDAAEQLSRLLRAEAVQTQVLGGVEGLVKVAGLPEADYVMAAIVGAAGLLPTLAAARCGKRILLANKEALVMSGALFMDAVHNSRAELLPIDSEHNAILQCMPPGYATGGAPAGVRRILLTASGGPFRDLRLDELPGVTPAQACAHPNWVMGRKISVDSATMMNKGLEVIEAGWLFGLSLEEIEVVLHPQSIMHSMVEYLDGSILAQLGNPDMRIPITHALAWPERIESGAASLDLFAVRKLDFESPDPARFPCLGLACEAWRKGGTAPAILNAANEVAVEAFLERRIGFDAIARVIEATLEDVDARAATGLEQILADDARAREYATALVSGSRTRAIR
jgi:1-deoxy-D-xylulose-5-phosphate reductoisomerase